MVYSYMSETTTNQKDTTMTNETKAQIISARIAALVESGMNPIQAVNKVLGEGTFEKIASDVYDTFNN